ncbi:MAG: DUF370 domain-containing protein [Eubacterium sp.]|nr:DUF370 domain-containing protein [Eubacterium sp.]
MMNRFINIGFGNIVASNRIIAVVNPDASPVKRLIQEAKKTGKLIDATCGRKTRAAIITDSDHIILAANQPETIASRLGGVNNIKEVSEDV